MPRKVVSGPDYDDDEYDYEDYEDDYDDDYEETEHIDVKPPVKEKGTCVCKPLKPFMVSTSRHHL
jgi:hypothetical protein